MNIKNLLEIKDFEYINNLNKINKIDDVFVIHYTTL